MRIAYGVHGYGRGHAARALAVLPELTRRHEVLVLAGGDAWRALSGDYPVVRIPYLAYHLNARGRRSAWHTVRRAVPGLMDLNVRGPSLEMVRQAMEDFAPDVVISDSEPWTHQAARPLKLPRISFDHFGVLVHCRWPMGPADALRCSMEAAMYRALISGPDRSVIVSFYDAPPRREGVKVVGPVLRQQVRQTAPSAGDWLLVYLSNGQTHYTPAVHDALASLGVPVRVYGTGRQGREGALEFRPPSNSAFVDDLAGSRAVFSTAGNQLISEAMHFRKPLLLLPEDSLEQRLNAQAVQALGIGQRLDRRAIRRETFARFLEHVPQYQTAFGHAPARDGCADAVAALEQYCHELAGR